MNSTTNSLMSISVVIPAYNSMKHFKQTLDSVLAQTLQPDEILVVDDGSKDETADFAATYGPPLRVIRQPNQGSAIARNNGAQQATSEWIALLDDDDIWEPNKLERQMQELARHPEADVCYTSHVFLITTGDTTQIKPEPLAPEVADLRKRLFIHTPFLPSATIIRRSTLLAIGGFNPTVPFTDDLELWLRLYHAGTKFAVCREPLLLYRRHPENTVMGLRWLQESMDVYRTLIHPHQPAISGWFAHRTFRSIRESEAAITLRRQGDPRHLSLMFRSILHDPFHNPHRYKMFAHMLYTRIKPATPRTEASNG